MARFWFAGCLAVFLAGCAHKPVLNTYRLVPQGRAAVMVPPEVQGPELAQRTFVATITRGRGTCPTEAGAIQLQARRGKLRITVDRDALAAQKQPGWLNDWTMRAEAQGCVAVGEGQKLGQAIVESVPLEPIVAFRLLHASDVQNGYVELGAENQLEVRSPILQDPSSIDAPIGETTSVTGKGTTVMVDLKLSSNVVGFETAWFGIQSNAGKVGFHFVPLTAERSVGGKVEQAAAPSTNYFQFPPQASYFRLFYKRDDNGVTAIVISGATREDLDRRTKAVGVDPGACEREAGMCLVLPKKVGVNPFLVANVNGKDVTVPLSGTVRSAMAAAGMRAPEGVLAQLTVAKSYAGQPRPVEFDRGSQEILNLKLVGGEKIAW
jgi:hypothetical protein